MGSLSRLSLELSVPFSVAIRSGSAEYGCHTYELTDENLKSLPPELIPELEWRVDPEDNGVPWSERVLELDAHLATWPNVVNALRREYEKKVDALFWVHELIAEDRELELFHLAKSEYFPPTFVIDDRTLRFREHPRVAALLPRLEKLAERLNDSARTAYVDALEGLSAYALSVPSLSRAAKEGYSVHTPALQHFIVEVQRFDREACQVFVETSHEWRNSKTEERRAPDEAAFAFFDKVKAHLDALPKPSGVDVKLHKIQRFRKAVQDPKSKNWSNAPPVTAIMVAIDGKITAPRRVLFIAEE